MVLRDKQASIAELKQESEKSKDRSQAPYVGLRKAQECLQRFSAISRDKSVDFYTSKAYLGDIDALKASIQLPPLNPSQPFILRRKGPSLMGGVAGSCSWNGGTASSVVQDPVGPSRPANSRTVTKGADADVNSMLGLLTKQPNKYSTYAPRPSHACPQLQEQGTGV